jgi:hypothetical protein
MGVRLLQSNNNGPQNRSTDENRQRTQCITFSTASQLWIAAVTSPAPISPPPSPLPSLLPLLLVAPPSVDSFAHFPTANSVSCAYRDYADDSRKTEHRATQQNALGND